MLACAGALGSVARYAMSTWVHQVGGGRFAYGTLAVNVLGCLALAFVMQAILLAGALPSQLRVPVTVGFFGAFTTFSTFGYETVRYLEDGAWGLALANVLANVILCLAATVAGLGLGRAAFGAPA